MACIDTKICNKCAQEYGTDSFYKDKSKASGLHTICKSCTKENTRRYHILNAEAIKTRAAAWNKANRKRRAQQALARKKTNVESHIKVILRSRLCIAVKNHYKSGSAVDDLGCSVADLKLWLEAQFTPGMSWENYGLGGWEIDHIVPLNSFDLTDRKQILKACHWFNLRPLWASDNRRRSRKCLT